MINFPDNPSNNQVFTSGNQTWVYDGTKWLAMGVAGVAVFGVTDGSSAAPGVIGEVITAKPSVAVPLTTSVMTTIATLTLSPGDWDVRGAVNISMSAAVASNLQGLIALTSGVAPSTVPANGVTAVITGPATFGTIVLDIAPIAFSFGATTPVYLMAYAAFSSGTATGMLASWIQARRMR